MATPDQIMSDVNLVYGSLSLLIPSLEQAFPKALGDKTVAINQALSQVQGSLLDAQKNMSAANVTTDLQRIEAGLNAVLGVLAAAQLPQPYSLILRAIAVLLPELEALLDQQQADRPKTPRITLAARGLQLDEARSILHNVQQ